MSNQVGSQERQNEEEKKSKKERRMKKNTTTKKINCLSTYEIRLEFDFSVN